MGLQGTYLVISALVGHSGPGLLFLQTVRDLGNIPMRPPGGSPSGGEGLSEPALSFESLLAPESGCITFSSRENGIILHVSALLNGHRPLRSGPVLLTVCCYVIVRTGELLTKGGCLSQGHVASPALHPGFSRQLFAFSHFSSHQGDLMEPIYK